MKRTADLHSSTALAAVLALSGIIAGSQAALALDTVGPKEIGSLSDLTLAETLQRLPGVQTDSRDGEGTQVRIRGLEINHVLLDGDEVVTGREMYQTGISSRTGDGATFQNALDSIPAWLIAGIDVQKTTDAAQLEGSLGGTINLHSLSAMDGPDGLSVSAIAKGGFGFGSDRGSYAGGLKGTYKLANTLGIVAGLTWDDNSSRIYEMNAATSTNWAIAGPTTGYANTVGKDYILPDAMALTNRTVQRKQFGGFIGIEYNPVSAVSTSLKWFHTDRRTDTRDVSDNLYFSPMNYGLGLRSSSAYSIAGNGVLQSGTYDSRMLWLSSFVDEGRNIGDTVQFSAKFDNGGPLRVAFRFAYARGTTHSEFATQEAYLSAYGISSASTNNFNDTIVNNYPNYDACGGNSIIQNDSCAFTYAAGAGIYPHVKYLNPTTLTNSADGIFGSATAWASGNNDERLSVGLDGEYEVGEGLKISAGVRYAARGFDHWFGRYLTWNPNVPPLNAAFNNWTYYQDPAIDGNAVITYRNMPERLKTVKNLFPQAGIGNVLAQDPAQMATCPSCWLNRDVNLNGYVMQFFDNPVYSYAVDNHSWSGYAMADYSPFDALHVNGGLRIVLTDLRVVQNTTRMDGAMNATASYNGVPVAGTPLVTRHGYTDFLPSLNLAYDLSSDSKVRFAAARVMAEPDYGQLGQGLNYYYSPEPNGRINVHTGVKGGYAFDNGNSGNPALKPYRASQFDLAYEYYFAKRGVISVDAFYKDIDNLARPITTAMDVADDFGGTSGYVATYVNDRGAFAEGIEFNAMYAFENGFGLGANYTLTHSQTHEEATGATHLPLPNFAENAFRVQTFYAKGPLDVRLFYTWTGSSFASTYTVITGDSFATSDWRAYNRSYGQFDASIGYMIYEKVKFEVAGRNLTGEAPSQYLQYRNQAFTYDQSGRRILASLKFDY